MRRRQVLLGAVAVLAGVAGCSGSEDSSDHLSTEYRYDESRQDSLFIENFVDTEVTVDVRIVHSANETMIENSYHIPPATGVEIPDIADVESEYTVAATYDGTTKTDEWTVLTCAHEDGPEAGGETAIGIEVDELYEDSFAIIHTGCDEKRAENHRDLTYDDHEEYKIDE